MHARAILAASLALALAACGPSTPDESPSASSTPTVSASATPSVTASPTPTATETPDPSPTPTPTAATVEPTPAPQPTVDTRAHAAPVVSNIAVSAGTITVDAYVADVLENGGECILTVDGVEVARAAAEADATVTWCEPLSASTAGRSGTVSVSVTYSSATRVGTSGATALELS